ncbi:MAG: hypothetical protein ACI4S4_02090 [Candidatus Ornithospirochaeta sp.]
MKKAALILLILALATTSAFAALIQVGPTARYKGDLTDTEEMKDILDKYDFGADARVNLGKLGIAANALFGKEGERDYFYTIMTANLRANLSLVELSIGAGFDLPIVWDTETGDVMIGGQPISNALEVFKESDVIIRAAAGVNLGGLGLSVDYKLPFSTIKSYFENSEDTVETFKKGSAAVSLLINLF